MHLLDYEHHEDWYKDKNCLFWQHRKFNIQTPFLVEIFTGSLNKKFIIYYIIPFADF